MLITRIFFVLTMRAIAAERKVSETAIRRVVHEDTCYKSYVMLRGQFLPEKTKKNRLITQEWLADNFYSHVIPNMWPPNSSNLNLPDYFVWGVVERETSVHHNDTKDSTKAGVVEAMANMCEAHVIRACYRFRARTIAVLQAEGSFTE